MHKLELIIVTEFKARCINVAFNEECGKSQTFPILIENQANLYFFGL
jgi:hypothetical protein